MNEKILMPFLAAAMILATSTRSWAFGEGGCGEGQCGDCHSLSREEAGEILKELVEKVNRVEFAEVPGLWLVEVESKGRKGPIYIDFSKEFAISGSILRLADREDIVRKRVYEMNPVDLSQVPTEDALLLGRAEAGKKVFVFTDPKCPWCKKLHAELKKVVAEDPNVAFYLKLFPLASHQESYLISKSVVCNKSMELLEDSFADKPVPEPSCETDALDRNLQLGRQLGIRTTPTLILPDGLISPGFKSAEKILELLGGKNNK